MGKTGPNAHRSVADSVKQAWLESLSKRGFRQLGDGRSLEQHAPDAIPKRPDTPSFDPAHFGVELLSQLV
jgi:hypothetical protein